MKKYLSRGLGFLVLGSLLMGATPALAVTDTVTQSADNITTTSATLKGKNGDTMADAGQQAFWYGTTSSLPFVFTPDGEPQVINQLPMGWVSGTFADTFGLNPGDNFSYSLSGLTPGTTYFYVAWSRIGGTWYPGDEVSFTTATPIVVDTTAPAVPTHLSPADDTLTTTALQTLIDWLDETDPSMPVTYYYEVSSSNATAGMDNAFVTPLYTSGALSNSEVPTPGTPDGVYYWHVRAVDGANNMSAWSTPWKITVDNTCTTDFDLSTLGSVNGKEGWSVTGGYDQAIVANTYGFTSFGCKTLRISNSVTSGAFGDQTFSPSNSNEAGENSTDNHFESQFDIASTSQSEQAGLKMSVSPDRGDGSRMSYLRFEDQADGIHVFFDDVQGTVPMGVDGCLTVVCGNFVETGIATLDRLVPHTIKFSMDFLDGAANDIVKIYIDGNLKITGTSWEDYYRFDPEQAGNSNVVPAVDSLIFRASGAAVLGNANNGFIFDNFGSDSEIKDPTPTTDASLNAGTNSVTLHGTNGEIDSDAGDSQGFWYGQTDEGSFTSGTNPAFPGGTWVGGLVGTMNHAAGGNFTYDLAGLAPSTTYYYVAWTEVGGIWYPGEIESFTTDNNPQTINGSVSTKTYGDVDFNAGYTATSMLPVTYTQTSPTVCTVSPTGDVHIVSVGSCTFNVDQSGGGTYDPAPTVHASFTVAPKNLTVTGITGSDKVYDGNTSASFTGTPTLVGVVGMDNVTVSGGTATFSNKNVGPRTLNFTGMTLVGLQAGNYTLTQPTLSANITARPITVTAVTDTKVYNGNNSASSGLVRAQITSGSLATPLEALLNIGRWAQTYNNENVGTNKVIAPTPATVIDGNSGNNYTVVYVNNSTGVITPRTLNVTPVGENKVYDATTNASVTFTDNRVSGDDLTIVGTAQFPNKNVGTGKVVSVLTVNSTGPDAGNYTINLTTGVTLANITTATLTATVNAQNKVYDTTDTASATCAVTPLLTDSVGCSVGAATFSDEDAGLGKTVTATGMSLTGPDAGNYVLSSSTGTDTADITAAPVTVSFTASDKTYDGNNSATILTRTVTGNISPDAVITATGGIATFASVNAGTHTVTATGFTLDDTNYTVTSVTETTATINPATLTPSVSVPESRVYNSTTNSSATCSVSPIEGDDVACVVGGASYDDKNVGGEKTVTVTGMTLSGEDAGNYVLSSTTGTAGSSITPLSLTVFASAQNKQVDGNTTATVTLSNNAFVGDTVTQTYTTADFSDALVGTGKTVTVLGIAIDGLDVGNYTLDSNTATTTADITSTPSSGSSGSRVRSRTVVGNTGTVLGAEKFNFTQNMRQGAVGNEVMELQKFLNANGFGPLVVDGKFGPITRAAVVKFQLANGLVGDGVVGPLTRAVLNK